MPVFKEVEDDGVSLFVWFREAESEELILGSDYIVVDRVLTECEHEELLEQGEEYDEFIFSAWETESKNQRLMQERQPRMVCV